MSKYDYELKLPWPPTTNHFHMPIRMGNRARCIKAPEVKEYQKVVFALMHKLGLCGLNITDKMLIILVMHQKTNHKYDCSNFLKAYEDAFEKCGFIENDHLIEYESIRKGEKMQGGQLDVYIRVLNQ